MSFSRPIPTGCSEYLSGSDSEKGSRWKVGVSQAYVRWLGQFPRQLVRKSHHWTTDAGGSPVPSRDLAGFACGWLLFRWLISRWGFGLPVPSKWLVGWCARVALITTAWFSVGSRWKVGVSQAYVRWLGQFPRQLVRKSHHWATDAGGSHVPSRGLDGWC